MNEVRFCLLTLLRHGLGEGNLIFCCAVPTDPNFRQTKIIIIPISYINISSFTIYISCNLNFFFQIAIKYIKNKNLVHLILLNLGSKETWSLYVTSVDIIVQVSFTPGSIFLFLDVPTLRLRIIIIILLTGRHGIILPTTRTTKN